VSDIALGAPVVDESGRPIGRVEAVFADYLLVRTVGLPVDLYIPRDGFTVDEARVTAATASAKEAYVAWHRPLKKAPHP
jgi:hypothetical protein